MSRTIEILINPKGEATVTTKGFAGTSCRDASKLLEEAMGQRLSEQQTAEFYQAQATEHLQQEQRG
jgi:hypothetical protein